MTKRYFGVWLTLLLLLTTFHVSAQTNKLQLENKVQVVGGSSGTEFWIAVPPNDFPAHQSFKSSQIMVQTHTTSASKISDDINARPAAHLLPRN